MGQTSVANMKGGFANAYIENEEINIAADPVVQYMTKEQLKKNMAKTKRSMEKAARQLDFMEAARLRDEVMALRELVRSKYHVHV